MVGGGVPPMPGGEPTPPPSQGSYSQPYQKKSWGGKTGGSGGYQKSYDKSPEVQASIKRQAIGHMTSRTMIGLAAHLTPENINDVLETIYNKFVELVG